MFTLLYRIWFCLVALPLLLTATFITSVATILCFWCPNSAFIIGIQRLWSRLFFWLLFMPVTVEGRENIEPNKSYVFVANHQSMLDVWLVYGYLPVIFKWIMKKEVDSIPLVGSACRYAGHICVDRSNPRKALASLERMKTIMTNGVCTVVFPEGTRTKTGKMARFKRGAFQIALDLNLDVVPISISHAWDAMPPGAIFPRPKKLKLVIGKPVPMNIDKNQDPALVRAEEEAFIQKVHDIIEKELK